MAKPFGQTKRTFGRTRGVTVKKGRKKNRQRLPARRFVGPGAAFTKGLHLFRKFTEIYYLVPRPPVLGCSCVAFPRWG